jgi:hypothetical protein
LPLPACHFSSKAAGNCEAKAEQKKNKKAKVTAAFSVHGTRGGPSENNKHNKKKGTEKPSSENVM